MPSDLPNERCTTLVDLLRSRADQQGDAQLYRYLLDGELDGRQDTCSYAGLDRRARAIAAWLQSQGAEGRRALLIFPHGLEFVRAFFGCLYAGVVAVPAYPPHPAQLQRTLSRLIRIARDAQAGLVLSVDSIVQSVAALPDGPPELASLRWVAVESIPDELASDWRASPVLAGTLALLQYTSGSTSEPKGVMVSHGNILHNQRKLTAAMDHDLAYLAHREGETLSSWVPMFHDMGLIGMVLHPLFLGGSATFLSPLDFLHKPLRWLTATSRLGTYMTGAPNFAYELCARAISEADVESLDLSRLEITFCSAETIRWQTLRRFASRFAPCGFRAETFYHAYGLAEVSLFLTGGHPTPRPVRAIFVDKEALGADRVVVRTESDPNVVPLLGCGAPPADEQLHIVHPERSTPCGPGEVGEIWYRSPSVALGYWRQPELTTKLFEARLEGSDEGPFLRTGDLGFLHDGELFVTGRRKDLIIIKGRNFYPQDIEQTVEASHPSLRPGGSVAFSVDVEDEEELVVLAEVRPDRVGAELGDALGEIAKSIWLHHDIDVWAVELLPRGGVHKTTSGKVQRQLCRKSFLGSALPLIEGARYRRHDRAGGAAMAVAAGEGQTPASGVPVAAAAAERAQGRSAAAPHAAAWIEEGVARIFGEVLGRPAVDRSAHFLDLGGHSLSAVQLIDRLNESLQISLSLRSLVDHPTVRSMASYIVTHRAELVSLRPPPPRIVGDDEQRFEPFALTDIQQAYWVGRSTDMVLGGVGTHVYFEFDREGLDLDRLEGAIRTLIDRHDALRTTFSSGQQRVLREVPPYVMRRRDLRGLGGAARDTALASVRARMSHRVYDPEVWPLFELAATELSDSRVRLHVSWDMLVVDAWSLRIVQHELGALYADPAAPLPEIAVRFRDYVSAMQTLGANDAALARAKAYWDARVDALPPGPQLPLALEPRSVARPRFERRSVTLDDARWSALGAAASRAEITPSAVLLSAFAAVLARWSRSRHFTLSLTFFNRPGLHPHIERVVGDFTSLVLLEVDAEPDEDFCSFARRLQARLWEDLQHRQLGGVEVLRTLGRRRRAEQAFAPVVFTSMLGLEDSSAEDADASALFGEAVYGITQTPQVWLDHQVRPVPGGVELDWDSVVGLFPDGMLDEMFDAYRALVVRLADESASWRASWPERWPEAGSTPPSAQRHAGAPRAGQRPLPSPRTGPEETAAAVSEPAVTGRAEASHAGLLQEGFLRHAELHPDAVAVRDAGVTLSYGALRRIASHYARELRARGAAPNTLVGIVMEKGWEQPAAALAVVLSGAAYVPIDAAWPRARRDELLARGDVRLVLSQPCVRGSLGWPEGVEVIAVEQAPAGVASEGTVGAGGVDAASRETDLAYVIYTSGSSGKPKGVMIDHRGAKNTIDDVNERFGVGPEASVLGVSSLSFDLSVYDIFGVLGAGGCLVLPEPSDAADPDRWIELVRSHGVTLWNSVPALLQLVVDRLDETGEPMPASLRRVLLSGDWIAMRLAHRLLREPGVDLVSLGGATECSIWSNYFAVDAIQKGWTSIPYGWPLGNQTIEVLDHALGRCPSWVCGVIHIGGLGVAKGYWKEPELSAASFVHHPVTGERLFRTGDLGRYLPDGSIEILGRDDLQVKVRGHRIELGEVESVVRQGPSVRDAVVVAAAPPARPPTLEDRALLAFVVRDGTASEARADGAMRGVGGASDDGWSVELRRFCESRLPAYMVPRAFMVLPALPVTANGKVDRGALERQLVAAPAERIDRRQRVAPPAAPAASGAAGGATGDEHAMAAQVMSHVAAVAGDSCVLRDPDAVFGDYGFDSMMGLRLRTRLERAFGLRLPATLIWRYPTPARLIAHLQATLRGTDAASIHETANPALRGVTPGPCAMPSATARPVDDARLSRHALGDGLEPVAIIGMSCRFPSGGSLEGFWRSLRNGVDSVVDLGRRWAALGVEPGPTRAWAGLLDDVTLFDAEFFGITPREAAILDPQQRLLLEVAWEALEASAIVPESLRGSSTGVFVGAMYHDYQHLLSQGAIDELDAYTTTGSGLSFLAGRLSYVFGLEGPSLTVDTACSSSLVALHEACQNLRSGDCDLALTGGVSVILSPVVQEAIGRTQALSIDGRCKTFDARANGFVRGEGCGVVVLKRLADARRDGDPILACIHGTAVNQDGRSTGLTAPNVAAQIALHRQALRRAGVRPEQIGFIETHGTGTSLGDPIELEALGEVYGAVGARRAPCFLGAVKTNIGHLEAAAGIASLVKTVLVMQHGEVPPDLHFQTLNPMIALDERSFTIPLRTEPWRPDPEHAFAAISSFGLSGTNAHVVLGPAPDAAEPVRAWAGRDAAAGESASAAPTPILVALSARDTSALARQVENLHDRLQATPDLGIDALGHALATERTHFRARLALVAQDRPELEAQLASLRGGGPRPAPGVVTASSAVPSDRLAFLFSGQGAQYVGMGRGLYESEPAFARAIDACARKLDPELPRPLLSVMFAPEGSADAALLDETRFTQPALFALEYALFTLWDSLGVRPSVLLGHSVGEIVAACVAGAFSLDDGLRLVAARARLLGSLPRGGAMVSIAASEADVCRVIDRRSPAEPVSVAGCNAPTQTVISGAESAVTVVAKELSALGAEVRRLQVSHAFHSPLMEPVLEEFRRIASSVQFSPVRIPLVSNRTGRLAGDELGTPEYWARQIREPVRFADGAQTLWGQGIRSFLEIGPAPVLLALAAASVPDPSAMHRLVSLRKARSDRSVFLESLAKLYVGGRNLDWAAWYGDRAAVRGRRGRVALPTYPFQRKRHWPEPPPWSRRGQATTGASEPQTASAHTPSPTRGMPLPSLVEVSWREAHPGGDRAPKAQGLEVAGAAAEQGPGGGSTARPVGRWLILADRQGLGDALRRLVEERGGRAACVRADGHGRAGAQPDLGMGVSVDPRSPEAVRALLAREAAGGPLDVVVHLWGLDDAALRDTETARDAGGSGLAETGVSGWAGALHLAQGLQSLQLRDPPRVVMVTCRAQPVEPSVAVAPEQALLWGLGGTVSFEHPEWRCLRVDVSDPSAVAEARALFDRVVSPDAEDQLALRQARQYVPRLTRCSWPPATKRPVALRADGTYVITGGLGGLGLSVAQWMASAGAGHLALVGRNGARSDAQEDAIARMRQAGALVTTVAADVADRVLLGRALDELRRNGAPIRGVVHAAGHFDMAVLSEQTVERFRTITEAKVAGGWNLHRLTLDDPLELFVLYSSMASLLGTLSLGPYVAGNAFLDALAHYRRSQGRVATSINWASFHDVGLATTPEWQRYRFLNQGIGLLGERDGTQALEALLRSAPVQIGVAELDGRRLMEIFPQVAGWPYLSELVARPREREEGRGPAEPPSRGDAELLARLEAAPPSARIDILQRRIRPLVADILRLEPDAIELDVPLVQLGVDSLMSMEIRTELEAMTGKVMPATLVWNFPTVAALAQRCLELLELDAAEATADEAETDASDEAPASRAEEPPVGYDDALALIDEILGRDDDE